MRMAARDREAEAASNARMCAHVRVFAHACLRACVLAFLRVCLRLNKTQHANDASLGMSSTLSTLSAFTNVKVKDVKDEFHQENCLFLAFRKKVGYTRIIHPPIVRPTDTPSYIEKCEDASTNCV